MLLKVKLIRCLVLIGAGLLSSQVIAQNLPGGTGGGGPVQAEFVEMGRYVGNCLSAHAAESSAALGIDVSLFMNALDIVGVKCAIGKRLQQMQNESEDAHYDRPSNIIYLDCAEKAAEIKMFVLGSVWDRMVVDHEYFRSLGEGNEYRYSSRINDLLRKFNDCR